MECSLKRISMIKRKNSPFSPIRIANITHLKSTRPLIKDNQTDKDGNLIYLYANNKDEQFSYIEAATNKGYNVLLDGWSIRCSYGKYAGTEI